MSNWISRTISPYFGGSYNFTSFFFYVISLFEWPILLLINDYLIHPNTGMVLTFKCQGSGTQRGRWNQNNIKSYQHQRLGRWVLLFPRCTDNLNRSINRHDTQTGTQRESKFMKRSWCESQLRTSKSLLEWTWLESGWPGSLESRIFWRGNIIFTWVIMKLRISIEFQNKRVEPRNRKLDHRKASRDFHFEIGYSLVIQNSQSNEKSSVPFPDLGREWRQHRRLVILSRSSLTALSPPPA